MKIFDFPLAVSQNFHCFANRFADDVRSSGYCDAVQAAFSRMEAELCCSSVDSLEFNYYCKGNIGFLPLVIRHAREFVAFFLLHDFRCLLFPFFIFLEAPMRLEKSIDNGFSELSTTISRGRKAVAQFFALFPDMVFVVPMGTISEFHCFFCFPLLMCICSLWFFLSFIVFILLPLFFFVFGGPARGHRAHDFLACSPFARGSSRVWQI